MTEIEILVAIRETEYEIAKIKKQAARIFGRGRKCAWPEETKARLTELKSQAKSYRAMLSP